MTTTDDLMINVYRYFMTAVSPIEKQAALAESRAPLTIVEQLQAEGLLGRDSVWPAYVFRGDEDKLPVVMESSGTSCVLLSHGGYWNVQNRHNTMNFPRIYVSFFGDTTRDDNAIPTDARTGKSKVERMYKIVNPIFHDPTNTIHRFGDLPVISTFSGGVPEIDPVEDSDKLYRLIATYEVSL